MSVSIHAPHAGRDPKPSLASAALWRFNPRAPCGARPPTIRQARSALMFQSTRPMRGATRRDAARWPQYAFQSTRPMRGATPRRLTTCKIRNVSIHAPHAGRDNEGCYQIQ